jgi:hypothetical protein
MNKYLKVKLLKLFLEVLGCEGLLGAGSGESLIGCGEEGLFRGRLFGIRRLEGGIEGEWHFDRVYYEI